jgi:hypothetical protein
MATPMKNNLTALHTNYTPPLLAKCEEPKDRRIHTCSLCHYEKDAAGTVGTAHSQDTLLGHCKKNKYWFCPKDSILLVCFYFQCC